MALTIEDGTGVAGADSYASVSEARAYASARGASLSGVDADVEVLLRKAADFIDSLEPQLKGSRVDSLQALAFPRENVYLFDSVEPFPSDDIPELLIKVQCQLALDASSVDLQPIGSGREVVREKVDVIEVQYSEQGLSTVQPQLNKAMSMIAPLLVGGGSFSLRVIRA